MPEQGLHVLSKALRAWQERRGGMYPNPEPAERSLTPIAEPMLGIESVSVMVQAWRASNLSRACVYLAQHYRQQRILRRPGQLPAQQDPSSGTTC